MKHIIFTLLVVFFSCTLKAQKSNTDENGSSYSSADLDIQPKYGGGLKDLYYYIHSNFKIPGNTSNNPSVFVTFIIEKDGTITSIKALPADGLLNAEAIRVIELTSGKWSPGKKEGDPVRSYFTLPIKLNIPRASVVADQSVTFSPMELDIQPEYPGGIDGFYKFVNNNFRIPEVDKDLSVKIFISFIVEKDGTVSHIRTLKDPGYGLGYEAEKVFYNIPEKWSPGIKDGNPVRTLYNLPIQINITD